MDRRMISLASTADLVRTLASARSVTFSSYLLYPGPVLDALEAAARRGAQVAVRLEGRPFGNPWGARRNAATLARLQAAGADAQPARNLHIKAAVVDGVAFLDERNFTAGGDSLVRDDAAVDVRAARDAMLGRRRDPPTATFAAQKDGALDLEERLLASAAAGDDVIVETESFGYGKQIYPELVALAKAGRHVRLLVNARSVQRSPRAQSAIAHLTADGVDVRATSSTEKFALAGSRGWIGSADATYDVAHERDWGLRTDDATLCSRLRTTFEKNWKTAHAATAVPRR
jgi:phosphatidylserine/phosphatidylglycerophosphate/cardiolipin synthase-like enzyme